MSTKANIIDFINHWRELKGLSTDNALSEKLVPVFVGELQEKIASMDFTLPKGTTIIGYTGDSNSVNTWKIARNVSETAGDEAVYITDLPAGELLDDYYFKEAIKVLIDDKLIIDKITSGYDNGIRLEGGSCGYGDYLSLDDFVSLKFMGESKNVSENLIVFAPEEIDPGKVFGATEIEKIFSNDTFQFINVDLCQYFGQKKLKGYAAFFSSTSSFC